jgi:hypothetical protein
MRYITIIVAAIALMVASASVALAHTPNDDHGTTSQPVVLLPLYADGRVHYDDPDAIVWFDRDGAPMLIAMIAAVNTDPTTITVEYAPDDLRVYPASVHLMSPESTQNFPDHQRLVEVYAKLFEMPLRLGIAVVEQDSDLWTHIGDEEVKLTYLGSPDDPRPFGDAINDVIFEGIGTGIWSYRHSSDNDWKSWLEVAGSYQMYETYGFGY